MPGSCKPYQQPMGNPQAIPGTPSAALPTGNPSAHNYGAPQQGDTPTVQPAMYSPSLNNTMLR